MLRGWDVFCSTLFMVDVRALLTERQLAVLKWVESGCPDDVPDLNASKRTARALEDRRLVKVFR